MKEWFKKLLKAIEESNKKSFSSQRLDCCDMKKHQEKKGANK